MKRAKGRTQPRMAKHCLIKLSASRGASYKIS